MIGGLDPEKANYFAPRSFSFILQKQLFDQGSNMMPQSGQHTSSSRLDLLLDAAASHFAANGYRETTIRDISHSIDMLPGSVYYYFPSKNQLLLAVYEQGVKRVLDRVDEEMVGRRKNPWVRLEAMVIAHLETILDQSDYARVLITVVPDQVPEVSDQLRKLRNQYEEHIREMIDDLPLPRGVDRHLLRLMLIGAVNWAYIWYKPGRQTPVEIGKAFVSFLRKRLESPRRK